MRAAPVPPLPLSQQVLSWIIRALGYGDNATTSVGVSSSTLKNAASGKVIPASWDDLAKAAVRSVGTRPDPDPAALAELGRWLRRWDERVGRIPAPTGFTDAEKLHMLLQWAIPQVGIRLGAIAVVGATRTGWPVDEWLGLTDVLSEN